MILTNFPDLHATVLSFQLHLNGSSVKSLTYSQLFKFVSFFHIINLAVHFYLEIDQTKMGPNECLCDLFSYV